MNRLASSAIATCAFLAGSASALAQSAPATADYTVVSTHDTASESHATRETLRVAPSFVGVTAAAGESAKPPSASSIACYNMAKAMLAAYLQHPKTPFLLDVVFVGKPLAIPLELRSVKAKDGASVITASGGAEGTFDDAQASVPGGLVIAAKLVERNDVIVNAAFSEITLVGANPHPVDRTQCAIERVSPHAPVLEGGTSV